jgi:uncharacterized membrane protein YdjX (TVP38/TMEM64 family)
MSESLKTGSGFAAREPCREPIVSSSAARRSRNRLWAVLVVVILLVGGAAVVSHDELTAVLRDPDSLRAAIAALGIWGPVPVIVSMTLAIVFSPLPSAPIALASGAIYGHTLGTLYVLLGSEVGALAAFSIARLVGTELIARWVSARYLDRLKGPQRTLMAVVFVTRLIPFVSFDAVSYAAGLTPLTWWRFALATLGGIVPASFLLAYFGQELMTVGSAPAGTLLLALGLTVFAPLVLHLIRSYRRH